jgi:membrane protease subunit HflC
MNGKGMVGLVILLSAALIGLNSIYIIKETEKAVLLEFGKVVKPGIEPGLHVKIPFVNTVRKFDARILTVDARAERYLTVEKKAVIVDSFAKWRVADVKTYYTATNGEEARAEGLLAQRINTGMRNQFGERTMHEVVSGQRDELMADLKKHLNKVAQTELGIEVVDVRVKRIDLPPEVSQSVYARMNTEREREAREHRSRGKELAEGIRAAADREKIIIESEAYRDAEKVRGEGDATAAAIYAAAYNKNPEFYAFVRSLRAYEDTFKTKSDLMLVDPDSEFFRYLNSSLGEK